MTEPGPNLTQRQVWALYSPLALSWLFMGLEQPISVKVISLVGNHRAVEAVWTAAFNALMAIALFVESPVIDLLATSTTLCRDRGAYRIISRFTLYMMGICAVAHALVVFTPLYGLITAKFEAPVKEALWLPLAIMIPWSPAIGWRRYKQGVLIRFGQTRLIGAGTFVRVSTIAVTGFGLANLTSLTGVMIAAIALVSAVTLEATFVHIAARRVIAANLAEDGDIELPISRLTRFHLPLTATTMMQLGSSFLVTEALAASVDHQVSWPAYQVALTLMWLHRAVLYAIPETIITLYHRPGAGAVLRRFATGIALGMSGLMALVAFTGIDKWFFVRVLGESESMTQAAHMVFILSAAIPAIIGGQCYLRGVLTALHQTKPRMKAVLFGLITMAAILGFGVYYRWDGAYISSLGPTLGALVEGLVLLAAMRQALGREAAPTR